MIGHHITKGFMGGKFLEKSTLHYLVVLIKTCLLLEQHMHQKGIKGMHCTKKTDDEGQNSCNCIQFMNFIPLHSLMIVLINNMFHSEAPLVSFCVCV